MSSDVFRKNGDGSQDEATLFSLANEYLEAASVLINTPPKITNYTIPAYYLILHASELFIKAYLHHRGLSISEIRNLNHNLNELLRIFFEKSMYSHEALQGISKCAKLYQDKAFEYRTNKKSEFSSIDAAYKEAKNLSRFIFNTIITKPKSDGDTP